jgi:hypothetical protein
MWAEIRMKQVENIKAFKSEDMAFDFFFEERIWYIAATIDSFNVNKMNDLVLKELQATI